MPKKKKKEKVFRKAEENRSSTSHMGKYITNYYIEKWRVTNVSRITAKQITFKIPSLLSSNKLKQKCQREKKLHYLSL